MKRKIAIVGTGGLAREIHQLILDINRYTTETLEFVGWLDENIDSHGEIFHGSKVLGGIDWLENKSDTHLVIGIGSPVTRRKVVEKIKNIGSYEFPTLIHPSAQMGDHVSLGKGVVICAGVVTTTDFVIGDHVLVNISATIAHEDRIDDYVTIAPAAILSGNVHVGEGTDVGTNATVIQGITIGSWSVIGAGAVVTRNIPANVTAVGAPAKVIKEREEGWYLA